MKRFEGKANIRNASFALAVAKMSDHQLSFYARVIPDQRAHDIILAEMGKRCANEFRIKFPSKTSH